LASNRKDLPDNLDDSDPSGNPTHPSKPLQYGLIVTACRRDVQTGSRIRHYIAS
jgi:hypothetical protein